MLCELLTPLFIWLGTMGGVPNNYEDYNGYAPTLENQEQEDVPIPITPLFDLTEEVIDEITLNNMIDVTFDNFEKKLEQEAEESKVNCAAQLMIGTMEVMEKMGIDLNDVD